MSRWNRLGLWVIVSGALLFGSASLVSAQELDNHWFVITCNIAARAVDINTGNATSYASQFKAYVYFDDTGAGLAPRGRTVSVRIFSQTSPGVWTSAPLIKKQTSAYNEQFISDIFFYIYKPDGSYYEGFFTAHVSAVLNLFHGGGELINGRTPDGTKALYGTIAVTGKLATSLPFVPPFATSAMAGPDKGLQNE